MIEIWQPRWHDRKVLVAKYRVGNGTNRIVFTKTKCYKDMQFDVQAEDIINCPQETNGSVYCYVVPLDVVLAGKVLQERNAL